jgi:hypothetical protein
MIVNKTGRKFLFIYRERVVVEVTTEEQLHAVSLMLLKERCINWPRYTLSDRMVLCESARQAIDENDGRKAYRLLCEMEKKTGHEYDSMPIVEEVSL